MKIVFMGTPEIAVPAFEALQRQYGVAAAVCQPDKPVGRRQVLTPPPIKLSAEKLGVPVFQPASIRKDNQFLFDLKPELIVVMAYGKILPREILELPRFGCVNLHASLLPKYRGAAPIQWALYHGETETGITAMQMDEGMDTGGILRYYPIAIEPDDDAVSLFRKLGELGGAVAGRTVELVTGGHAALLPQVNEAATMAPMIRREDALVSFAATGARQIVNAARAFSLWPGAYFIYNGQEVKLLKAVFHEQEEVQPYGTVLSTAPLCVSAKGGAVELVRVKPQGSREMTGSEFLAGRRLKKGDLLF